MNLTFRQLEQFVAVADEQHFGHAAEVLGMRQPPLSEAISKLERQLGTTLISRTTRNVTLTAAGKAFAADSRRLLAQQHAAVERVRRIGEGTGGEVSVGYFASASLGLVPRFLRQLARSAPDLRVRLREGLSAAMYEDVLAGSLDLALIRTVNRSGLSVMHLGSERLVAVVPRGHRLANRSSIKLAELAQERFALPDSRLMPTYSFEIARACLAVGFTPHIGAFTADLPGQLSHVVAGNFVTLVPAQSREFAIESLVFLDLDDSAQPLPMAAVNVCFRQEHDATVSTVIAALEAMDWT